MNKNILYIYGEAHLKHGGYADLSHACLKIFNEEGDEMSISFDDCCGTFKHLQRSELCIFPKKSNHPVVTDVRVSPEGLLKRLAKHLNYNVSKKE